MRCVCVSVKEVRLAHTSSAPGQPLDHLVRARIIPISISAAPRTTAGDGCHRRAAVLTPPLRSRTGGFLRSDLALDDHARGSMPGEDGSRRSPDRGRRRTGLKAHPRRLVLAAWHENLPLLISECMELSLRLRGAGAGAGAAGAAAGLAGALCGRGSTRRPWRRGSSSAHPHHSWHARARSGRHRACPSQRHHGVAQVL